MTDPTGQSASSARPLHDGFRIGHDLVAVTPSQRKDPWMMTIPCRVALLGYKQWHTVIYPHGGDLLAVEIDYRPQARSAWQQFHAFGCINVVTGKGPSCSR